MSTFIHGIGASSALDSSGEVIDINGLDISSLEVDGILNYEHKADTPDQILGKVLKARKIFSEKDCEDDHQLYFWNKCKLPFVYIMGELFDDYKDSAKEVAGMFRYDMDRKGKQAKNVVGFSIEGSKIDKKDNVITRSIARKVTITNFPCNRTAIAEMVPVSKKQPKDNIDEFFKSESVEIELFKPTDTFSAHNHASILGLDPVLSYSSLKKNEDTINLSDTDEDMNPLMSRTENKYFISKGSLDYVTQTIKENLKGGDVDTEVRYSTNKSIYLDNKDLDSLKDTLNSVKPRIKIRIRQYAPNGKDWEKVAYVEIKAKKEDGSTKKTRIRIFSAQIDLFLRGVPLIVNEDLANINKDITKATLLQRATTINNLVSLYGFQEQIEVRYERRAYTDNEIRITIDENLRYLNAQSISDPNSLAIKSAPGWPNLFMLTHQLKNDNFLVLEVKFKDEMPKWIKRCLDKAGAKEVKFSKYGSAMVTFTENKAISGSLSATAHLPEGNGLNKTLDAGSGMAAPSQLTGGAALAKESLVKPKPPTNAKPFGSVTVAAPKPKPPTNAKPFGSVTVATKNSPPTNAKPFGSVIKKKEKSKFLLQAEDQYNNWSKKEQFEQFMAKKMPHLTKGEVKVIGQTMLLNKSISLEKALSKISKK